MIYHNLQLFFHKNNTIIVNMLDKSYVYKNHLSYQLNHILDKELFDQIQYLIKFMFIIS